MAQLRTPRAADTLERTLFFSRQVLTPADLAQNTEYLLHRLRRHNRLLHGWGIRLGLHAQRIKLSDAQEWIRTHVLLKGTSAQDYVDYWLQVVPGYGITPPGDEIYLPRPVFL